MPPRDTSTPFVDIQRREILRGVLALPILAAGISCGDDDDDGGATPAGPTGAAPRTFEHMFGATEISGVPQRVVSVGWTEQDALLALGVVPVAATEWVGDFPGAVHPWAEDRLGDADLPVVLPNEGDGIDYERIASLEPDLILALYVPFGLTQEVYDRLSQIAPTLAPPAGTPDGGISWQDLTITVGEALDKRAEAEEIVAGVEARFDAARAEHPEFEGALAVNAYPTTEGTFQVYPPPDPGGQLLSGLGFKVPDEILELAAGAAWVDLSGEQLRLLDIDLLLWLVEDYNRRDELLADPVYQGLNVSQQGRHVFLAYEEDGDVADATSMQTVLSLPFLLDNLVPKLAAAIDGDPATSPS